MESTGKQSFTDYDSGLETSKQGCTRYEKVLEAAVPSPLLDEAAQCWIAHSWAGKGYAANAGLGIIRQLIQQP